MFATSGGCSGDTQTHLSTRQRKGERLGRTTIFCEASQTSETTMIFSLAGAITRRPPRRPVKAQAHQAWYIARYPEKLHPERSVEIYEQMFPGVRALPRSEQKRRLKETIEDARANPAIMKNPGTDARPLILPWPPL